MYKSLNHFLGVMHRQNYFVYLILLVVFKMIFIINCRINIYYTIILYSKNNFNNN